MQIRLLIESDCDQLHTIYSYYVINTSITLEYEVPTLSEFSTRIQDNSNYYPYLVAEANNKIIGFAYATRFRQGKGYDRIAESSIYLDSMRLNKGLGGPLYIELMNKLIGLGITECMGVISLPNSLSVHFHENLGFELIGTIKKAGFKFGQWCDVAFYQKTLIA